MSAGSYLAAKGFGAKRRELLELAAALRDAPGVVNRATEKVKAVVDTVADSKLAKHVKSGYARDNAETTADGGLVLLKTQRYLGYHKWWPFGKRMPGFIVKRAVSIFAAELLLALGQGNSAAQLLAAGVAADDAAAGEKKAQKARDRETRRLDNRIKRQEAREERRADRQAKRDRVRAEKAKARHG